jgi:hypothetical protein
MARAFGDDRPAAGRAICSAARRQRRLSAGCGRGRRDRRRDRAGPDVSTLAGFVFTLAGFTARRRRLSAKSHRGAIAIRVDCGTSLGPSGEALRDGTASELSPCVFACPERRAATSASGRSRSSLLLDFPACTETVAHACAAVCERGHGGKRELGHGPAARAWPRRAHARTVRRGGQPTATSHRRRATKPTLSMAPAAIPGYRSGRLAASHAPRRPPRKANRRPRRAGVVTG